MFKLPLEALLALCPMRQAAALCYRIQGQEVMVLLITGRESGRWGVPKGTIEVGETSLAAAEREAFEEAGVIGTGSATVICRYQYRKNGRRKRHDVKIHALAVSSQESDFPEKGQRQMRWVCLPEAALVVDNPVLKGLLRGWSAGGLPEDAGQSRSRML